VRLEMCNNAHCDVASSVKWSSGTGSSEEQI